MSFEWQAHHFVSGRLCLDFVNTVVYGRDGGRREDRLPTVEETLAWIAAAPGAPAPPSLGDYETSRFFLEALRVRAACDGLFRAVAAGESIDSRSWRDLATLHGVAMEPAIAGLVVGEHGLAVAPDLVPALPFLAVVTLDAIALALSPRLARVKECPGCNWLFVDGTRNGSKRWCEMRTCGNRAKARRHGARTRSVPA
jgi:predicted RNA-binding Zn ribbon-like protein